MNKLPDFALYWAHELGSEKSSLTKLGGGVNNHVYVCSSKKQKWVIKGYAPKEEGHRDRMKAEVQFLKLANKVANELAPQLIYEDESNRCVVLEYLEGKPFTEGLNPHAEAIAAAVKFIRLINKDLALAEEFIGMEAAEGFLCLSEHIANVKRRLSDFSLEYVARCDKAMAIELTDEIQYELEIIRNSLEKQIRDGMISDRLDPNIRCVSPSDFGFHNAVITNKGVQFIDFEFAGWDDPTKTTLDFILQPRIPVLSQGWAISKAWKPEVEYYIRDRCKVLGPILRLKWSCIILSVLNPSRLIQLMGIITEENPSTYTKKQLQKARTYLDITRKVKFA